MNAISALEDHKCEYCGRIMEKVEEPLVVKFHCWICGYHLYKQRPFWEMEAR